ncbi:ArnT family glycosyltransferase [Haloarcula sp. GH36]|uniref:ArnT family glycosyltransferase n=1 Tax=Haloarcula montana TaxID=3111776 RepID=UPI002D79B63F|nr:hypothetical protein [Haloarcula sp. GH36]
MSRLRNPRVQAMLLAAAGGLLVFLLATVVFPYHTSNHDEAVYLQQAAMLLEGKLYLHPPVEETFRPWFFVEDGDRLYSKYAPVPAAMFAVGKLLGGYRVALGLIATGVLALTYQTTREVFDGRTGVLATGFVLGSPLFLVNASVFLSYIPTTFWNVAFAAAYLHADRTGSRRTGAIAGAAIGIAFFARPYTSVLFAAPFICHALWSLRTLERPVVERVGLTGVFGLAGVAVALGYNAVVTGSPFVFPYQAFAPQDGLGFGYHEIAGYSREFTPALSLQANAELLSKLFTRWLVAGPLGTLAAALGLGVAYRRGTDARTIALAGVLVTVTLGNFYFWGTMNMLGDVADPTDGLVGFLGPFYHVDLLVPLSAFGAVGVRATWDWSRAAISDRVAPARRRGAVAALLLVLAAVVGPVSVAAANEPLSDNYEVTQQYEVAYEPFEERDFTDSVVFLPTTYGDWLNHPFQPLRNDPGFDGETVYAMQHRQFAVVDAYPDRQYHRYVYRGEWVPFLGRSVEPRVQRVRVAEGSAVTTSLSATLPPQTELVSMRLSADGESDYATVAGNESVSLSLRTDENLTTLTGPRVQRPIGIPTPERGSVELYMFVDYGSGVGVTYRVDLPVDRTGEGVRTLTPKLEVCYNEFRCGGEAAYIPGSYRQPISLNATMETA